MTYCVGVLVNAGLVMISDTRTNAGIDNISTFKKMHTLVDDDERQVFVASAGSLSVTQSMLSMLKEGLPCLDDTGVPRRVETQHTMFRIAQLVGEALSTARKAIGQTLVGTKINSAASILLGGRLGDGAMALYLVYAEGNFIECKPDAPFMQIGELKYGKPILDRMLHWETPIDEAVKIALLSFDSTMRSNLSVGLPFDVVVIPTDRDRELTQIRIEANDNYFALLSSEWGRLLDESRTKIPDPPFLAAQDRESD